MAVFAALNPVSQFFELSGLPLNNGNLYFGQPNLNPITNPIQVYWDDAATQTAAQPIKTLNGYPVRSGSPAQIFIDGDYSLLIVDSKGRQVLYSKTSASVNSSASVLQALNQFISDLSSFASSVVGAGKVGFNWALNYAANTIGWGVRTAENLPSVLTYIPVSEWAAILNGTSTTDVTSYIQTALNTGKVHFAPRGKYNISATTGLVFPAGGGGIVGSAKNQTLFFGILGTGGSTAQIAAYTSGSIFRRAFNPAGTNAYLGGVRISDIGIILTHPTASITTTAIQVGIDLRNIGRFDIERVHVGNDMPISSFVARPAAPSGYAQQGYGILTGSVGSSDPAYAGGEVGNITACSVWGAFKGITMDDITLSPLSASHGINVKGCDIQGCHSLLAQEQQYTAGFVWGENVLQNVTRQQGNATATYCMRIAGYDNEVASGGYIEAGSCDYLLRFDSASDNNRVQLTHYSATAIGIAAFSDAGLRNFVNCRKDTGSIPGGIDSSGLPLVRYDRSYLSMSAIAHWSGSAMVLDGGFGITVTRPTTAGDYLFTFDLPVLDVNSFTIEVSYDTNASGHGGTHTVISRGTSNVRIQFYSQNGATTTAIDPRFVFVRVTQVTGG